MARASVELINAIQKTAENLLEGSPYQWGHMGACNCGNLVQQITKLTKAEIHERAMKRKGDWNDQCDNYCPSSGFAIDDLIGELLNAGLDIDDLKNLENLSDKNVLKQVDIKNRHLRNNRREDVILYLKAWAQLLEKELVEKIDVSALINSEGILATH